MPDKYARLRGMKLTGQIRQGDYVYVKVLSGAFTFRGSVTGYDFLPTTDNQVGDVWIVTDSTRRAWAWNGDRWVMFTADATLRGGKEVFVGTSEPEAAVQGDIWIKIVS